MSLDRNRTTFAVTRTRFLSSKYIKNAFAAGPFAYRRELTALPKSLRCEGHFTARGGRERKAKEGKGQKGWETPPFPK